MNEVKRLIIDLNWSGNVGGYAQRYCLFSWNDLCQIIRNKTNTAALYRMAENPNYRHTKPRVAVIYQN